MEWINYFRKQNSSENSKIFFFQKILSLILVFQIRLQFQIYKFKNYYPKLVLSLKKNVNKITKEYFQVSDNSTVLKHNTIKHQSYY